jgi:predicted ribosomally synthesized peptide with nif11-like leader
MQNFEQLRAKVIGSAELQAQVKNGANLIALAKANGIEISQSELEAGVQQLNSADADLSDFELELISGGTSASYGKNKGRWS